MDVFVYVIGEVLFPMYISLLELQTLFIVNKTLIKNKLDAVASTRQCWLRRHRISTIPQTPRLATCIASRNTMLMSRLRVMAMRATWSMGARSKRVQEFAKSFSNSSSFMRRESFRSYHTSHLLAFGESCIVCQHHNIDDPQRFSSAVPHCAVEIFMTPGATFQVVVACRECATERGMHKLEF